MPHGKTDIRIEIVIQITCGGRPLPYFKTDRAPNSLFMACCGVPSEQGKVCTSDSRKSVCVPSEVRGCD